MIKPMGWGFLVLVILIRILFPLSVKGEQEYKIEPGVTITKENYKNYLSDLEELLFPAAFTIYTRGLEMGWITMPIKEKMDYSPPKGYGEATAKYTGQCRTGPRNTLIGWVAGVPFPDPKTALELAWNVYRRTMHPDDYHMPAYLHLIDQKGNIERSLKWSHYKKWWMGRVDKTPLGEMPGNNGVLNSKESLVMTGPFDIKGFALAKIRYEDIDTEDDNYSYIPAIRRIRRLTGADVTDPLLGSDAIPDDFETWRQKINPKMTFKILGQKDFLVPCVFEYGKRPPYESIRGGNCFNVEWEIKPIWILEIMPNDSEYVYSKRIVYVDKEDGCGTLWGGDGYDQKGRLLRSVPMIMMIYNYNNMLKSSAGYSYYNHLSGHATLFDIQSDLSDIDVPVNKFTIKYLLREAR